MSPFRILRFNISDNSYKSEKSEKSRNVRILRLIRILRILRILIENRARNLAAGSRPLHPPRIDGRAPDIQSAGHIWKIYGPVDFRDDIETSECAYC